MEYGMILGHYGLNPAEKTVKVYAGVAPVVGEVAMFDMNTGGSHALATKLSAFSIVKQPATIDGVAGYKFWPHVIFTQAGSATDVVDAKLQGILQVKVTHAATAQKGAALYTATGSSNLTTATGGKQVGILLGDVTGASTTTVDVWFDGGQISSPV